MISNFWWFVISISAKNHSFPTDVKKRVGFIPVESKEEGNFSNDVLWWFSRVVFHSVWLSDFAYRS